MIRNTIALFKARKDPDLAKQIASDMIVEGAIDRASWPLWIAKLWMILGIAVLVLMIVVLFWLGTLSHWTVAIPALPLAGIIYLIMRIWGGINTGLDKVTELAKTELSQRVKTVRLPTKEIEQPQSLDET